MSDWWDVREALESMNGGGSEHASDHPECLVLYSVHDLDQRLLYRSNLSVTPSSCQLAVMILFVVIMKPALSTDVKVK